MNRQCLVVLLFFFVCLQGFAEESNQILQCKSETHDLQTDEEIVFESTSKYECKELRVTLTYGYNLLVTVESLKTNPINKDFLIIKSGETIEDATTGIILTQAINTPRQLLIASNRIYIKFSLSGDASKDEASFKLIYKRIGNETLTTTERPTTVAPWPTVAPDDIIHFTVNITGKNDEDYKSGVATNEFKTATAAMATEYCSINLINHIENITDKNVLINKIIHCPQNWPEANECVQINFSLPIIQTNADEYQLKREHLKLMWERYSEKYLLPRNLNNYDIPDTNAIVTRWNVLTGLLLFFVLVIAGAMIVVKDGKFSCCNFTSFSKTRRSSGTSYIIEKEHKISVDLSPHRLQVIPSIFEDADYAEHTAHAYHQRVSDDSGSNSDSDSDVEHYPRNTNNNNNVINLRTDSGRDHETEL